jgi:hypothetical protein
VAGDRHVVFCLADLLSSNGPVHIGFLNAITGFPEDGKQDDHLAPRLPEADPPRGAIERDPQLVNVISVLQFLDVVASSQASGSRLISCMTSMVYTVDGKPGQAVREGPMHRAASDASATSAAS